MAYERNWHFAANFDYHAGADITAAVKHRLWAIKAFLTGQIGGATQGLWTVTGSSDGVNGGMDGADRWGASYDASKIVAANNGSAHSWVTLRSPVMATGITMYMMLAADNVNASQGYATLMFGKAAFTGGSVTNNPANADSWTPITSSFLIGNVGSNIHRLNGALSATGDFFLFGARVGYAAREPETFYCCIAPVGCADNDLYPVFTNANASPSQNAANSPLTSPGTPSLTKNGLGWGNAQASLVVPVPITQQGASYPDLLTNKLIDIPAYVIVTVGTSVHARGRLPDMGVIPAYGVYAAAVTGSTIRDGANNITHITVGSLIVPFNAVPDMV